MLSQVQLDKTLGTLEKVALIFAACIHDFRHTGYSNGFLENIGSPLAFDYAYDSIQVMRVDVVR
jgi:hypothetical protein